MIPILENARDRMNDQVRVYFEHVNTIYLYLFYGMLTMLSIIFLVTVFHVIKSFNTFIMQIKRMLSIIPASLLAAHIKKIKQLSKRLS